MVLVAIILLALVSITAVLLGRAETKYRDQRRKNAKKGTR